MSKLEELIQQLCPDGVECRNLEECCNILDKKENLLQKRHEKPENIDITEQTEFKIMFRIIFSMGRLFLLEKMEV